MRFIPSLWLRLRYGIHIDYVEGLGLVARTSRLLRPRDVERIRALIAGRLA